MNELRKLIRRKEKAKEALDALPLSPEKIAFNAAEKELSEFLEPLKEKARKDANQTVVGEKAGKITNDKDGVEYNYVAKVTAVIPTRTTVKITAI